MPKIFTSETQKIGELGEKIAVKFLMKQGFEILERNYTQKWGEIDIIASNNKKLHFIEVKSVSDETLPDLKTVIHETKDRYRPEDNMHPWKLKRLSRTIQTYLASNEGEEEVEWQFDLLVVRMDTKNKKARVETLEDIVL